MTKRSAACWHDTIAGMTDRWDPAQYHRFRKERRQPWEDLVALVEAPPNMRAVDLGCGSGELTRELADRLEVASLLGIDSSAAMLEQADADTRVTFELGDLGTHPIGQDLDLVFSSAALHWLPDHAALFERMRRALGPAGQLAVQMPANFEQPTHTTAVEIAGEAPFADVLGGRRSGAAIETPETYALLLNRLGFRRQLVRQQIYLHLLPSKTEVVEWVKGSMLTWYHTHLGDELFAEFVARYSERLLAQLPDDRPYPLTFRRLLLWASLTAEPAMQHRA
jgi:trans-aconitate 2-methyltransferase